MFDYEARRVIEALRSGVPSRAVGQYFSEARPQIMKSISDKLQQVIDTERSDGMIISGKYGEGKTHLLNTVYNMAHSENMVVSFLSLSKETPMDKLYLIFQKVMENTYLPGREQPGFMHVLDEMTPNSPLASELLLYSTTELITDKIYYLLKAYLNTEDQEEKFLLQADLEGDFISNAELRRIYKRIFNQTVKYKVSFSKTKHYQDYFSFMSYLFRKLGYNGWVILFDETELMGRFGKKARLKAYANMAEFLQPSEKFKAVFTMFALSASYAEDVIEGKHEFENLEAVFPEQQEPAKMVLNQMLKAQQLVPLTKEESQNVLMRVQEFHGKAYNWAPQITADTMAEVTKAGGYLLRTKIRAAVEFLDQLYQYGEAADTKINELGKESFEEEVPDLAE